jgi:hypothetical protein
VEGEVEDAVGQKVDCETVGSLAVEGGREKIYQCIPADTDEAQPSPVGCFVVINGQAMDVSSVARGPVASLQSPIDC